MSTETSKSYIFSWHDAVENDIWKWLIPHVMTRKDGVDTKIFEATDGGKNCIVTMQINGIEVDTKEIFEHLVQNMEWIATKEAKEIVSSIPGFDELSDLIYDTQNNLKHKLHKSLKSMGLEIHEDD